MLKGRKRISVCIIGYGIHPPWNEGCVVTARDVAGAIKRYCDVALISIIDPFRHTCDSTLKTGGIKYDETFTLTNIDSSPLFTPMRSRGRYVLPNNLLDIFSVQSNLRCLDSKHGIDIIHIFNVSYLLFSALAKFLLRKKVVAHAMSAPALGDSLAEPFIDAYIGTSKLVCGDLESIGLPKNKVHYIPPVIDTKLYRPLMSFNRCQESRPSCYNIVYMGNLTRERFPTDIINELRTIRNKNFKLSIYCPDTAYNKQAALSLAQAISGTNIKFRILVSDLSDEEKIAVYNSAHIVIFPFNKAVDLYGTSINRSKPLSVIDPPLTLLEGMAVSRIVVASKTLSIPNIIENNVNGFLVDPGDFNGFADKINAIIENFPRLEAIGANARQTIQRDFSSELVAEKLLNVYESILV